MLSSCSCIECTYYNVKGSIVTYVSSFFVPDENEIKSLVSSFAIRNKDVDWSFVVPSSIDLPIEIERNVQISKIVTQSLKGIGWYKKVNETKFWPIETEVVGEFVVHTESDDESKYQPFTKTMVLLLYKNKKDKWAITHTIHEQQPGVKVTPIYKAESTYEELTMPFSPTRFARG